MLLWQKKRGEGGGWKELDCPPQLCLLLCFSSLQTRPQGRLVFIISPLLFLQNTQWLLRKRTNPSPFNVGAICLQFPDYQRVGEGWDLLFVLYCLGHLHKETLCYLNTHLLPLHRGLELPNETISYVSITLLEAWPGGYDSAVQEPRFDTPYAWASANLKVFLFQQGGLKPGTNVGMATIVPEPRSLVWR